MERIFTELVGDESPKVYLCLVDVPTMASVWRCSIGFAQHMFPTHALHTTRLKPEAKPLVAGKHPSLQYARVLRFVGSVLNVSFLPIK